MVIEPCSHVHHFVVWWCLRLVVYGDLRWRISSWNPRKAVFRQTLFLFFLGYACRLLLIITSFGRWCSHIFADTDFVWCWLWTARLIARNHGTLPCQVAVAPAIRCHGANASCCGGWSPPTVTHPGICTCWFSWTGIQSDICSDISIDIITLTFNFIVFSFCILWSLFGFFIWDMLLFFEAL